MQGRLLVRYHRYLGMVLCEAVHFIADIILLDYVAQSRKPNRVKLSHVF